MKDGEWVSRLEAWYKLHARPLPWRKSKDPYRIWLSEVMLQQTQVATVIPYYEKFLESFPTLEELAAAEEAEVLARWSGLGYYSRAKNLHRGAKFLVETRQGKFPRTVDEILEVPGIGPYTAGAVLSIAFNLPVPIVDGNVQRVFSRFFAVEEEIHLGHVQKFFWETAGKAVSIARNPSALNQALMELGATVCIKGVPRCLVCPLRADCQALQRGLEGRLPRKKIPREKKELWWVALVMESEGKLWLHQNPKGEWWSDLWDFPHTEAENENALDATAQKMVTENKIKARFEKLPLQKHTVTHHRLHVAPYLLRSTPTARAKALSEGQWFDGKALSELPVSSLVRKVLSELPVLK